ncbi:MAG: outer membrane lipoprotein carrier protein LolA [Limimaricola sp.]|uniref:LolA family protein n=1 Tax=Limimaricola sp. TaxID=2211665 RepID=UPI001D2AD796|nr:outer membrane lipoprotein carrier protein LolA [Limimaricola sp.]MBI1416991.1 outer membrane lipoprotein carrier protein LolA [Limimaricola sp.]
MDRRRFLGLTISGAAVLGLAGPAAADEIPLDDLSRYLTSLQTVEAKFTQVNADGSISTGTLKLKRPGRIRFEYDPPDGALVVAGGGQLAIFDPASNEGPTIYPLSRTPLSLILAPKVDLSTARMVVDHGADATSTTVTAQDPDHPEYGTIQLVFTANPTELRQWVVTDDTGSQTTVILGDMVINQPIGDIAFNIIAESAKRGF